MNLNCGVQGEAESETHPIFACHHCGMPVCELHGWVLSADDAFHGSRKAADSSFRAFDDRGNPVNSARPGPRAAMHCPGCAEKYHPRSTDKHHGWVNPKRVQAAASTDGTAASAPGQPGQQAQPGWPPQPPRMGQRPHQGQPARPPYPGQRRSPR